MSKRRKRTDRSLPDPLNFAIDAAFSATTKVRARGVHVPVGYRRAVLALAARLLPSDPRSRDTHARSSRSTAPFQTKELFGDCPAVLEETRSIVSGKVAHFRAAQRVAAHPLTEVSIDVPPDIQAAVDHISKMQSSVSGWRLGQLDFLRDLARRESLVRMSKDIMELAPPHVQWAVGPQPHPALVMVCIDALDWPDKHFAYCQYVEGWPVVGWPTDTGLYRHRSAAEMAKDAAEYIHPDRLARMNARSNGSTVNRLRAQFRVCQQKGDGSRLASFEEAYSASIAEVVAGTAEGPFTFEQFGTLDDRFGVGGWRGSPRHAVWQGDLAHVGDLDHGKWRPVDDATRSKINPSFRPIEKVSFPRPDYLATMARVLYAAAERDGWLGLFDLGAGTEDEPQAFRNVPCSTPQYTVVFVVNPQTGMVEAFIPRGHNFGLRASPPNYCPKPELMVAVARRLFAAVVDHYMDDYVCIEPSWARGQADTSVTGALRYPGSSQGCLWAQCSIFGFPLAEKKHEEYSHIPSFIGTTTDFSTVRVDATVRLSCKASTRAKVLRLVEQYLQPDATMTSAQAATMYGKCQWVLLHGRIGRSALSSIKDRQYRLSESEEGSSVTEAMRDSLCIIRLLLGGLLPAIEYRLGSKPAQRPVIILTDAMWNPEPGPHGFGRMAWLVSVPGLDGSDKLYYASAEAEPELLQWSNDQKLKKSFIVFLEVVALCAPYFSSALADLLRGRDVIHYADNTSANAGVVKGCSPSPDCDRFIGNLHFRWAQLKTNVWVTYVASDANLSDDPSRRSSELPDRLLEDMGAVRMSFDLPSHLRWSVAGRAEMSHSSVATRCSG